MVVKNAIAVGPAEQEFDGAALGDARRTQRLKLIAGLLDRRPGDSFPTAMASDAALEGFYRFINSDAFSAEDIVAPHIAATTKRALAAGPVLAIHDTTQVCFSTDRDGVGITTGEHRFGYLAHATLLATEAEGLLLGAAYIETLTRSGKKWKNKKKPIPRPDAEGELESKRWLRGIDAVEPELDAVHVTDAEGHFFELLAHLTKKEARFVIRAVKSDRKTILGDEELRLFEAAAQIEPQTERTITISVRKHSPKKANHRVKKRHPERTAREATVVLGATRIQVPATTRMKRKSGPLEVNLVRIWEPSPPANEPAVEWMLLTTEDATTPEGLERITDIYRKRWIIEEYFKALKSGCELEKRQVESYDALRKVLALFVPIAYRLLLLRDLHRLDSNMKADVMFHDADLKLMASAPANRKHPPPRTIADAFAHLARMGGHLRSNGLPGWQVLTRAYKELLAWRYGYEVAMAQMAQGPMPRRSDQS